MEHRKSTKSEKEYVKAIIQSLSLQRLTDQEIVDYLHNEKQIDIARSTVTYIRNKIEKQAAKWYLELKESTSKYIAAYKQRIDCLFSYQKKLHEIIAGTKKDEVKIRAISELHSIEMDIFNLWKQLPNLEIADTKQQEQEESPILVDIEDLYGVDNVPPATWNDWVQCDGCKRWWSSRELLNYHKKKKKDNSICGIPNIE